MNTTRTPSRLQLAITGSLRQRGIALALLLVLAGAAQGRPCAHAAGPGGADTPPRHAALSIVDAP